MAKVSELQVIKLHVQQAIEAKTTHFLVCKTRPKSILDIIVDDLIPDARDIYYVWPKDSQSVEELKESLKSEGYQIIAEYEISTGMTVDDLFDLVTN